MLLTHYSRWPDREPLAWLLSYLQPEAPRLLLGTGALAVASFVNFRTGAQFRRAIDDVAGGGSCRSAVTRGLLLFGVGAAAGCVRTIIFDTACERLRALLLTECFSARLLTEPDQVRSEAEGGQAEEAAGTADSDEPSGEKLAFSAAALDSDVNICATMVPKLQNIARYTCSVLGGTITMFYTSWKLSAAVWPVLVTGAIHGAFASGKREGKSAKAIAQARQEVLDFAEERLQYSDLVRWFSRANVETDTLRSQCDKTAALVSKAARVRGVAHLVLDFAAKGGILCLCSLGGKLVQCAELTAGELTGFVFHSAFMGLGLYGLVGLAPEVVTAREAARRLSAVVVPVSQKEPAAPAPQRSAALSVKLDDVRFAYPNSPAGLAGFSLELPAGATCALVGPSGSGKTTVLRLLLRDFDNYTGQILVDGQDIRSMARESLRASTAIVPQQPALLGTTVFDAIAFGAAPGSDLVLSDAEGVARAANAHDFVVAKAGAYESVVGRGGGNLSGGERQRVALARAYARHAPLLLVDEPTSALDAGTAAEVSSSLLAKHEGRPTTLIATHSLSLIRSCDSVAVLSSDGRIVQHGTFASLIVDQEGALAKLMKAGGLDDDVTM